VAFAHDTLVFASQRAEEPVELKVWSPAGGERALTSFTAGWASGVSVRRFTVVAPIGEVDGWYVSPAGAGGPLPTVLLVHGGPHFTYGESCNFDIHALCAAGFGVVFTNPRGSNGYGDAFAQAVHEDWAEGPAADLLAVVDHVVASGWADGARLGVAGNSYGGYMTTWLCATTDRFRAGVAENPVTDLASMYATSDIGVPFFAANFRGAPHERPDLYRTQSPLWEAHRCRTPLLFVTGDKDCRCPAAQAFAMHRVLCDVGTPSEVLVLPGSSHEGSTYGPIPCRLAHDEALTEWMTRWL
jgi:LSD1 subclass zinc finger protein